MKQTDGLLARLGDLAFRRRRRFVAAWVAALVAVLALGPMLAGEFEANFATPGSESDRAANLIQDRFPDRSSETVDVVWESRDGALSPRIEERVDRFIAEATALEGIGAAQPARASPDGTIAMTSLQLDVRSWDVPTESGERMIELADEASGDGLRIELGGGPIQMAQGGTQPEVAGLVAAAFILLIAFGSVVAAGLPLLTALFGLGISAMLIGVLTALVDVPEWAPAVASLIGIGVGIDYALLILTRFRSALGDGKETREALVEAVSTAGRSALIAGGTVVISLLGLFAMGVSYMNGVALAASLSVLVVMAAAVTLLPALLAMLGKRVNRLKIPGLGRPPRPGHESPAFRWSHAVQRRPWTAALAASAVLIALTLPVTALALGFPDAGNDRSGTTTRASYDLVVKGFGPGANGPLLLAAELPDRGATRQLDELAADVRRDPGVAFVSEPRLNDAGDTALMLVAPSTSPQDERTGELVERLRGDVIPEALDGTGVEMSVGGLAASFIDMSEYVSARIPLFVSAVVGLSFLLLLVTFRAPVVALKAGLMTLLSVGAAYGVVALAAEGGFLGELMGIDTETPVPPFIPVMMFAILFGLSMDYEVFLLSRIREEYLRDGDTRRAVADGLGKTARVITAAAAIMVAVFLAFLLSTEVFLKLMGLGMATAIFVDATIVRMVLVPALMQLLGRRNWWIPSWLDRALPRVGVEPAPAAADAKA